MPGPGGGSLSTWRDKKDNNSSKKDDDISKKDDDLYHPWLVENKAKKGGDGTKKEDARSPSQLKMPGPGEEESSGAKASGT